MNRMNARVLTPFNTALGTLNSIDVSISGTLAISGTTAANQLPVAGGAPNNVPYTFVVQATQDFDGLGGEIFHFNSNGTFTSDPQLATGVPAGFTVTSLLGYSFTLNAATDLAGLVTPSVSSSTGSLIPPISGATGLRSDFSGTLVNMLNLVQTASLFSTTGPAPVVSGVTFDGLLQIDYHYTPVAPPADVVPEPASLALTAVGGVIAAAVARRRRSSRPRLH